MKNWLNLTDPQPFKDIAIFSADFYGHSYWSTHDNQLTYVLHFVDRDILPEDLCLVAPEEAADLRKLLRNLAPARIIIGRCGVGRKKGVSNENLLRRRAVLR